MLTKARGDKNFKTKTLIRDEDINQVERLLSHFPQIVARARADYAPQYLVTYLTELASAFNSYYATHPIIGSAEEAYRLTLTAALAAVLKNGLWLLGIEAPERM